MTPAARVQATIDLLTDIEDAADRPADGTISKFLRARRYIGSKDRSSVTGSVFAILRHRARLDWWLAANDVEPGPRSRAIAALTLLDGYGAEQVDGLFPGDRYGPKPLTPTEQRLTASTSGQSINDPEMPRPVALECPDWVAASLRGVFGEAYEAELAGLLNEAPVDLRVNTLKAARQPVLDRLLKDGFAAEPTPLSPIGIRLAVGGPRPNLSAHSLFQDGVIEVQDEGSQIAALLVGARAGHQVVDICAGAGGKSLAMAAAMGNKGRLVAADISKGRLARSKERLRRAGVDNVEPRQIEPERDRWVRRSRGKYDRVLVDAPCTGTGAWRRNPDARWRPVDLERIVARQIGILGQASRMAKPGGRVIYVTCSLLPEENEQVVDAVKAHDPALKSVPIQQVWDETIGVGVCPGEGEVLRLTPHRHGTDGFFVAVLERAEAETSETTENDDSDVDAN